MLTFFIKNENWNLEKLCVTSYMHFVQRLYPEIMSMLVLSYSDLNTLEGGFLRRLGLENQQ